MDILDNHLIYAFELKQTTQKKAHINELKFPGGMKTQLDHEDLLQIMISSDNKPCVQLSDALAVYFLPNKSVGTTESDIDYFNCTQFNGFNSRMFSKISYIM